MLNRYGIGVRINGHDVGPVVWAGAQIERGRMDSLEQPQADTLTMTLFTKDGWPQNPRSWFEYGADGHTTAESGFEATHDTDDTYEGAPVYIGLDAEIWVSLTTDSGFSPDHDTQDVYDGREFRRFTGKVNAFDYSTYRLDVSAVSGLEAWARRAIITSPSFQPSEDSTDVDLAQWLASVTPSPTTLHIVGDDGPLLIPWKPEDYPLCLLDELRAIAADSDGLVYATREGNVTYRTRFASRRRTYIPGYMVDLDALAMSLELGTHRNRVTVEYGEQPTSGTPPMPDGPRPTYVANYTDSQGRYGRREEYVTTRLANLSGAMDHGGTLLNLYELTWAMPDLLLQMVLADSEMTELAAAIDIGERVHLGVLPAGAPLAEYEGEVIGYSETLSSSDWELELHLGPEYTRATGS